MEFFRTDDGLNLAYLDEGPRDGLPVLCLAGLTRNSRDFDHLAPHLSDCRLIRMDYRGRGKSDHAPDHTGYQVPIEAADALSLLDYLAIDRAAIIGTSRGGLIAMVLAATAPGRLIGVCLNDIGPVIEQTGLDVIANYIGQNPPFPNHQDYARVKPAVMRGFANVPPERWLAEVRNQSTETPNGLVVNYDPALRDAFMASAASAAATPNLWPLFDAMRDMPLAIIRGANSDLLSPETTAEMVARHPGAILANVPDRAHVPFLDEPEALAAIHEWIGQCRSR